MKPKEMKAHGIYVHVPFCQKKCIYCDFVSFACKDVNLMMNYADAVCYQINDCTSIIADNATVYFGGGTPSILPIEGLRRIVQMLKDKALWNNPQEATIECNPRTVDIQKLTIYKKLGFDRISFGIQSFRDDELLSIGRIHNCKDAIEAVNLSKQAGFKRINIDLIYGLPGQTIETWKDSLQKAVDLGTEHISVYGLIVEENTSLSNMLKNQELVLPDDDICCDMYDYTRKFLNERGFLRYEISNFCKKGCESRHNLVYWNYLPYIGFGASATGFDGWHRLTGNIDVKEYIVNPLKGSIDELTNENRYSEFMFMNLRKAEGADLLEFSRRYGNNIVDKTLYIAGPFINRGLLLYDEEKCVLKPTERGMALGNQIFTAFV